MTSIEVSSPPLNESLDYWQPLELGNFLGLDARRAVAHRSRHANGTCSRTSSTRSEAFAATAGRLPDLRFSKQVADSDLPAEEDQQ
jgi:hypothetical protein